MAMTVHVCRVFGSLVLGVAATGCGSASPAGEGTPPDPHAAHDALLGDRTVVLEAGKFLELNCEVPASAIVAATAPGAFEFKFASDQSIAWNLHEHDGHEVKILGEGTAMVGSHRFIPSHPGPVSLLWKNASDAVAHVALHLDSVPPGTGCTWYP